MPLGDQTVGLASGLYRARGLYGRAVALHNWGVLVGQLGQLAAIIATGSLLAVTIAYAATQALTTAYFLSDRCSPPVSIFARGAREAFVVLDYRPVSQGGSVCSCGCH